VLAELKVDYLVELKVDWTVEKKVQKSEILMVGLLVVSMVEL
jgi:hypothetical protein